MIRKSELYSAEIRREPQERLAHFFDLVCEILKAHPEGLSEYDLLCALDAKGENDFSRQVFESNLSLFRAHFLLFHLLYALGNQLHKNKSGFLKISCTNIVLCDHREVTDQVPSLHDPLRKYYSDITNLQNTTEDDVQVLLDDFWNRYTLWNKRANALDVLGLEGSVEYNMVKKRYHQLVMENHPDRGGDKTKLQEINAAMEELRADALACEEDT